MTIRPSQVQPAYYQGFARNAAESANPGLWRGLVGAWMPMLGGTGNDVVPDLSGFRNDISLTSITAADWKQYQFNYKDGPAVGPGWAIDFDGAADYGSVGTVPFDTADGFSCDCLFMTEVPADQDRLVHHMDGTGSGRIFLQLRSKLSTFIDGTRLDGTTDISVDGIGEWYHGAVTHAVDGDNVLYLNGVAENSNTTTPENNIAGIAIGSSKTLAGNFWDGPIAIVRIWNRVLSPVEVKLLHADPMAPMRRRRRMGSKAPAVFTLTADAGAFTMTGTAANLEHHRVLAAAAGGFTVSGAAASLKRALKLPAVAGVYAVTGSTATLTYTTLVAKGDFEQWFEGPLWLRAGNVDTTLRVIERVVPTYKKVALASGTAGAVTTIEHGLNRVPIAMRIVNLEMAGTPTHFGWYRDDADGPWTVKELTARFLFDDGTVLLEIF